MVLRSASLTGALTLAGGAGLGAAAATPVAGLQPQTPASPEAAARQQVSFARSRLISCVTRSVSRAYRSRSGARSPQLMIQERVTSPQGEDDKEYLMEYEVGS